MTNKPLNLAEYCKQMNKNLIYACKKGYIIDAKELIKHGADIHQDDDLPLITARNNKHYEIVKYLAAQDQFYEWP